MKESKKGKREGMFEIKRLRDCSAIQSSATKSEIKNNKGKGSEWKKKQYVLSRLQEKKKWVGEGWVRFQMKVDEHEQEKKRKKFEK